MIAVGLPTPNLGFTTLAFRSRDLSQPTPHTLRSFQKMKSTSALLLSLLAACGSVLSRPNGNTDQAASPELYAPLTEPSTFDIPPTLHDLANKRVVELLERQAYCRSGTILCPGGCCASSCCGSGCCRSGTYCTTIRGYDACCPNGKICTGLSGECQDSGYIHCGAGFNYCCPPGQTCYNDSFGTVRCGVVSGGGGGSGGDGSGGNSGGDNGGSNGDGSGGSDQPPDSGADTGGNASDGSNDDYSSPATTTSTTNIYFSSTSTYRASGTVASINSAPSEITATPTKTTSATRTSSLDDSRPLMGASSRSWDLTVSWVAGVFVMIAAGHIFF